ncbi:MAG: hypothetical protein ACM3ZQ_06795 [Bacillota bacterium]
MISGDRSTASVIIPKPSRRLLAQLREAVLSVQHDPEHSERQGRALTDLAITAKDGQLKLTCEFESPTSTAE